MFERVVERADNAISKEIRSIELRRIAMRRFMLGALFFIGTVLAGIGWFIEWKGWDHLSVKLQHLTILALVGHAIQVVAAFGLMLLPDKEVDEVDDDTDDWKSEA